MDLNPSRADRAKGAIDRNATDIFFSLLLSNERKNKKDEEKYTQGKEATLEEDGVRGTRQVGWKFLMNPPSSSPEWTTLKWTATSGLTCLHVTSRTDNHGCLEGNLSCLPCQEL